MVKRAGRIHALACDVTDTGRISSKHASSLSFIQLDHVLPLDGAWVWILANERQWNLAPGLAHKNYPELLPFFFPSWFMGRL